MDPRPSARIRQRQVWLSPYLLAVALIPAVTQQSLRCSPPPTGDTTLAVLELEVGGENQIAFDSQQRMYDVSLPAGTDTAILRVQSTDPAAQVWYNLVATSPPPLAEGVFPTGGGEVTLDGVIPEGESTLSIYVRAPGRASGSYQVNIQVGCSQCSDGNECTADTCDPVVQKCVHATVADGAACDFGGLPGVCIAGLCEEDLCAGVGCDDGDPCTTDSCDPLDGSCTHTNACQDAMFMGLGDLPGSIFQSVAWAVSADGNVVVGDSRSGQSSPASPEAFRWENGMMVGLGDLPGALYESRSLAVSADGSVIVGRSDIGNGSTGVYEEAFRWTESDGMVGLGDLPGGLVISAARGVSADGSVIVGDSGIDGGTEAFRWTAATGMEGIGHLYDWGIHGNSSQAFAVSADGSVIVGGSTSESSGGSHYQAFRWTESEGMLGLGDLPGGIFESIARAVSADGSVIVGQTNANEAFRWTESGGMVGLGDLPGFAFYSVANAVSADGSIVVGVSQDDPTRYDTNDHAFIWDELNGIRNLKDVLTDKGLDLSEWELMSATGVSADGRTIVGHGVNPAGDYEGWIAYLGFP